jgi:hypothetical protein
MNFCHHRTATTTDISVERITDSNKVRFNEDRGKGLMKGVRNEVKVPESRMLK